MSDRAPEPTESDYEAVMNGRPSSATGAFAARAPEGTTAPPLSESAVKIIAAKRTPLTQAEKRELCDSHESLRSQLASMTPLSEQLLRFAGAALTETRVREIGDWDGASIQDALEVCGLIVEKKREVPCGESCNCLEFYGTGEVATCYPITELGNAAVAAWRSFEDQSRAALVRTNP